jgi:dTDP-4-dehydrorhamnose 3,5-epimerase-like enzyme
MASNEPDLRLIEGGLHVDGRGVVTFVNDFDFKGVDRFYTIRWHRNCEPRGWVGHRREHKWFVAIQGMSLIAVVKLDSWESPASDLPVERFLLSAARPQVLHVPPGHATAIANLSADVILMVFSSGKIEDAKTDDYRFAVDAWPVIEPQ